VTEAWTNPAAVPRSERFPPGIPFIVGNEGAERFSYYGMRAILYIYLTALYTSFVAETALPPEVTAAAKARATSVTHLFMAGVYAFPMIGAVLADRWLGKYAVILGVSVLYCAGHAVLAIAGRLAVAGDYAAAEQGMYLGLSLVALGTGGIKPCVSANVGDQFSAENAQLVTKVYQIFYFIINFGSFFSTLITPYLYAEFGPELAFGVPGIMMGIAAFIFWLGRHRFTRIEPKPGGRLGLLDFISSSLLFAPVVAVIAAVFVFGDAFKPARAEGMSAAAFYWDYVTRYLAHLARHSWPYFAFAFALAAAGLSLFALRQKKLADDGLLAVLVYSWRERKQRPPGSGFFEPARRKFGEEAAEGPPAVFKILVVFSMTSVFWALFDQHASTWVDQAKQLDRNLSVPLWSGRYVLVASIVLALFGGTRLIIWVMNREFSRSLQRALFGVLAAALAVVVSLDVLRGEWLQLELKAAQLQALNPLMVMMIIPLMNWAVYRPLEKRGIVIKPLLRMTAGMFLAAVAFAIAALLQARIEDLATHAERVHAGWQVPQYWLMTTAEVLVSITGLEFAYTQAPRRMKSTIMGFWLLGVTFGNVLVAFLSPLQTILSQSEFFWVFTALMAAAALAFAALAYTYKGKTYLQAGAASQ